MTYITCQLGSGLGNQMFQVATTLATAWEYNCIPVFKKEDIKKNCNNIFRKLIGDDMMPNYVMYLEDYSRKYMRITKPTTDVMLVGYYQSFKYFQKYEKEIRDFFKLSESDDLLVDNYVYSLRKKFPDKKLVALQLYGLEARNLDYINESLAKYGDNVQFVCFTDDVEWCSLNVPRQCKIFIFEEEVEDYIELYIISKLDSNIISNTSFSWWSAFLGGNNTYNISPYPWSDRDYSPCIYEGITQKVSIVITSCDKYVNLIEIINSVVCQSYPNIEIIVVDKCSTDKRYRNLDDLYIHEQYVKFIHLSCENKDKWREYSLKMVEGIWVAFLNDNDKWIDYTKIYRQLNAMIKYNAIVSFTNMYIKNTRVPYLTHCFSLGKKMEDSVYQFSGKDIEYFNYIMINTCIIHKSIINEDLIKCLEKNTGIYISEFTSEYDSNHGMPELCDN